MLFRFNGLLAESGRFRLPGIVKPGRADFWIGRGQPVASKSSSRSLADPSSCNTQSSL